MSFDAIGSVLMLAVLLEGIVQVIKTWVPEGARSPGWLWPVCSAGLGVLLCALANVDLLRPAGITLAVPLVGEFLTGVLISRGASFVHDLWSRISDGTGYVRPDGIEE